MQLATRFFQQSGEHASYRPDPALSNSAHVACAGNVELEVNPIAAFLQQKSVYLRLVDLVEGVLQFALGSHKICPSARSYLSCRSAFSQESTEGINGVCLQRVGGLDVNGSGGHATEHSVSLQLSSAFLDGKGTKVVDCAVRKRWWRFGSVMGQVCNLLLLYRGPQSSARDALRYEAWYCWRSSDDPISLLAKSFWAIPPPWCFVSWWAWCSTRWETWDLLGRMTGCLTPCGTLAFLRRPPTCRTSSSSRKGSSRNRLLGFFSWSFRCLADALSRKSPRFSPRRENILISSWKWSCCTHRMISKSSIYLTNTHHFYWCRINIVYIFFSIPSTLTYSYI